MAREPNPNPKKIKALWEQFKEILRSPGLRIVADGTRLKNDVFLKVEFHQWITDGAGARENHNRTPACHPRDSAHYTPQHKELRQIMHEIFGASHLRFGNFVGMCGDVVDRLAKAVHNGEHTLMAQQLQDLTGICGPDPYHSDVTPMDGVRINPGLWHLFATWARFWLAKLALVMKKCGTLKQWVRHMHECVKIIGHFKF